MLALILATQVTCVPYLNGQSLCRWGEDGGPFQIVAKHEDPIPKRHSWMKDVLYASLIGEVAYFATHTHVDVHFKRVTARQ